MTTYRQFRNGAAFIRMLNRGGSTVLPGDGEVRMKRERTAGKPISKRPCKSAPDTFGLFAAGRRDDWNARIEAMKARYPEC